MRERRGLTVVKLGGSYAFSSDLQGWLAAIASNAGDIVLVPGGGPFADAVRSAQPRMGFDDDAAHHMALLGMDQYGRALAALNKRFTPAASIAGIRRALRAGNVPVWSPTEMVLKRNDIPRSWEVTSDGLAAWLACRIGARRVLLIKHVDPPPDPIRIEDLVARGVVDRSFAAFLRDGAVEASIVGPAQRPPAALNGGIVGSRIALR
ncbi:MAG: dihydroneopterin aldolase [Xanthobacteraceae bacterium]|jgi:dihydroneopterin aldolase